MFTQYHQNHTPDADRVQQQTTAETEALDAFQPLKEYVQTIKNLYLEAVRNNESADKILSLRNQLKSACNEFDSFRTRYLYPDGTPIQSSYIYERCLNEKISIKPYIPPRRFFTQLETYISARQLNLNDVWKDQLDMLLTENQKAFLNKKKQESDNTCTYRNVREWFIDRFTLTETHLTQWIQFYSLRMRDNQSLKAFSEFYKREIAKRDMEEMPGEITLAIIFLRNINDHSQKKAIRLVDRHARSRDLDCDDVSFLVGFANEQWDYFGEKCRAQEDI